MVKKLILLSLVQHEEVNALAIYVTHVFSVSLKFLVHMFIGLVIAIGRQHFVSL